MTIFFAAALNVLFASALVGVWAYMMASTRHMNVPGRAPAQPAEHVLHLDRRSPQRVPEPVAA